MASDPLRTSDLSHPSNEGNPDGLLERGIPSGVARTDDPAQGRTSNNREGSMRKHLATLVLAVFVGVLGFAVSGVAVAAGNETNQLPPGQGECGHGNSMKPCKDDPQPDKGKDCEEHGNNGGVNEDHCAGETTTPDETTPDDTTPTETTPDEETTPQDTVPTETTSTPSTPPSTDASDATSTQVTEAAPSEAVQSTPASVESPQAAPAVKKAAVKNEAAVLESKVEADAPKPSRQAQQAPVTL
jgi:hypothetical protein